MEQYNSTYHSGPMGGTAKVLKKGHKRLIVTLALVLVGICIFFGSYVVTYQNEYTLIKQFGKVERVISEPGISFKIPFIQTTSTLPKEMLIYDLAPTDVITADKKSMVADSYVLWRIDNPLLFVQTMQSSIQTAETTIYGKVFNAMKTVISSHEQSEVVKSKKGGFDGEITSVGNASDDDREVDIRKEMIDSIGESLKIYGIELNDVVIKRLDLPDDNKAAVYERMISERNNKAAELTAEGEMEATKIHTETDTTVRIMVSEAEAEAEQLIAEGEAEYMRILSEAYNDADKADFYTFVLSLDAAKKSLKGDKKTLILDKDSPIAQIFNAVE